MSWESDSQSVCPCPCGKGKIFQNHYLDDWNRYKSDTPVIDCEICKQKYHIEPFHFHTCDGEYRSNYYCVKNDYPPYTGPLPNGKYTGAFSANNVDFVQYLIECYALDCLQSVLEVLNNCGTYSKIPNADSGILARKIIRSYKSFFNTQRISTIKGKVNEAINSYYNFDIRFDKLEKARIEYNKYCSDMKRDSILLDL